MEEKEIPGNCSGDQVVKSRAEIRKLKVAGSSPGESLFPQKPYDAAGGFAAARTSRGGPYGTRPESGRRVCGGTESARGRSPEDRRAVGE